MTASLRVKNGIYHIIFCYYDENGKRKQHSNINNFLQYALRLDMIENNPAKRVTLPKKVQSRKAKFLSPKQLQALLRLFWGDPIEPVVYLAVHLGVRRSEACGLQWESVDFERRRIIIRHTAVAQCGKVILSENAKSESSRRVLAMSVQLRAIWSISKRFSSGTGNCLGIPIMSRISFVPMQTARPSTLISYRTIFLEF